MVMLSFLVFLGCFYEFKLQLRVFCFYPAFYVFAFKYSATTVYTYYLAEWEIWESDMEDVYDICYFKTFRIVNSCECFWYFISTSPPISLSLPFPPFSPNKSIPLPFTWYPFYQSLPMNRTNWYTENREGWRMSYL